MGQTNKINASPVIQGRLMPQLRVNQREIQFDAPGSDYQGSDRLLAVLHEERLPATRFGCGLGQCGACAVLIDDRIMLACDVPLWSLEDKAVVTLEALAAHDPALHDALQQAFIAEQAAQCGYCSAGILLRLAHWLRTPEIRDSLAAGCLPEVGAIRAVLDSHLCRCGSHERVVRAVLRCAQGLVAR